MNKLKRFLSLALAVVLAVAMAPAARAATYTYAVDGGNLHFDPTTGAITDCDSSVYSADIPEAILGVPVTSIGKSAFANCSKLTSVTIPETVTVINGSGAYNTGAFYNCDALTSVTIPDSVTEIADYTFYGCGALRAITIPGSIKTIPSSCFSSCDNLRSVTLSEGVEVIAQYAFRDCKNLEELTLPDSVKELNAAFSGCTALTTVTLGSGLKYIAKNTFPSSSLESLYFRGDAPGVGGNICGNGVTPIIYYLEETSGWTTPTWNGLITQTYTLEPVEPEPPLPEYRIDSVTVCDQNGKELSAIPQGTSLATVAVTNQASAGETLVFLAAYTAEGQYQSMLWVKLKNVPVDATVEVTLPVDNPDGQIANLKAFLVASLSDLTPLGTAVSFLP